jgi:perosamine synthetase
MKFIPVNEPKLDGNEKKYLNECIDTGWISWEGPFVEKFEEDMAQYTGREFAVSVSNGSAALEVAVMALELEKGSEIIVPTFTIISCLAPIIRCGLKPVLVDSYQDTWNMNVEQIEDKITSKTRAIMVVHIYGLPVDMNEVIRLAKKYNLYIIEDAAEMHGQTYNGKRCGSFGDISTFSFYPNKLITSGEGGMVLTDNKVLAERCKSIRNLYFNNKKRYVHEKLGYNFRMTNLQAAIGCAQFEKINDTIDRKREIGRLYTELLKEEENLLVLPIDKTDYAENLYWVYGIVLKNNVKLDATQCMQYLKEEGIGSRGFFWCMHEQPVFNKMNLFKNEQYPIAENLARKGFYLPSGLTITADEQIYVVEKLKSILKKFSSR